MTAPLYVATPWTNGGDFSPGVGLPVISPDGVLITDQGVLNTVLQVAATALPDQTLRTSNVPFTAATDDDPPLRDPYVRYDTDQPLTDVQQAQARENLGVGDGSGAQIDDTEQSPGTVYSSQKTEQVIQMELAAYDPGGTGVADNGDGTYSSSRDNTIDWYSQAGAKTAFAFTEADGIPSVVVPGSSQRVRLDRIFARKFKRWFANTLAPTSSDVVNMSTINALVASSEFQDGATLVIPAGYEVQVDSSLSPPVGKTVHVDARGASLVINTASPMVVAKGAFEAYRNVTAVGLTSYLNESKASVAAATLTLDAATPSTWNRGDLVKLWSDDPIPERRPGMGGLESRLGQFARVISVDTTNASAPVVTLAGLLRDTYATAVKVAKVNPSTFTWQGGTIRADQTLVDSQTAINTMFALTGLVGITLRDIQIPVGFAAAIFPTSCYGGDIGNLTVQHLPNFSQGAPLTQKNILGYTVLDGSCEGIKYHDYVSGNTRHAWTDDTPRIAVGNTDPTRAGRSAFAHVHHVTANGCDSSSYAPHHNGYGHVFSDLISINSNGFGIGMRGAHHRILNFTSDRDDQGAMQLITDTDGGLTHGIEVANMRARNSGQLGQPLIQVSMHVSSLDPNIGQRDATTALHVIGGTFSGSDQFLGVRNGNVRISAGARWIAPATMNASAAAVSVNNGTIKVAAGGMELDYSGNTVGATPCAFAVDPPMSGPGTGTFANATAVGDTTFVTTIAYPKNAVLMLDAGTATEEQVLVTADAVPMVPKTIPQTYTITVTAMTQAHTSTSTAVSVATGRLTSAIAAGVTSLPTNFPYPQGALLTIDRLGTPEQVTVLGPPTGTPGAWTIPVTATTLAHASLVAITAVSQLRMEQEARIVNTGTVDGRFATNYVQCGTATTPGQLIRLVLDQWTAPTGSINPTTNLSNAAGASSWQWRLVDGTNSSAYVQCPQATVGSPSVFASSFAHVTARMDPILYYRIDAATAQPTPAVTPPVSAEYLLPALPPGHHRGQIIQLRFVSAPGDSLRARNGSAFGLGLLGGADMVIWSGEALEVEWDGGLWRLLVASQAPPWRNGRTATGQWQQAATCAVSASTSLTAAASGTAWFVPVDVAPNGQAFDTAGLYVATPATSGSGAQLQLAIYPDNGTGQAPLLTGGPTATFGTIDLTAAGANAAATVAAALPRLRPGRWWLVGLYTFTSPPAALSLYCISQVATPLTGGNPIGGYRGLAMTGLSGMPTSGTPSPSNSASGALAVPALSLRGA